MVVFTQSKNRCHSCNSAAKYNALKTIFLAFLLVIFGAFQSRAATNNWIGAAGGGAWTTTTNWSLGAYPGSSGHTTDDVTISAGTSVMTFTGMSSYTINSLTISGTTGSVTWSSGASTLTITSNFISSVNVTTGVISINSSGTGSNIASGKTLTISSASTLTIGSGGIFTVNGSITTTSAATTPIVTGATTRMVVPNGGIINYACGATLATIPLMSVQTGGVLNITSTNTVTLSAIAMAGTLSINSTGSTAISASGSSPVYAAGSTLIYLNCTAIPENSVVWPTGTNGPTNVTINSPNGVTITSTSGRQIKGTLTLTAGVLTLSGSGNVLTFNGDGSVAPIVRTTGTITCTSTPALSFSPTSAANWAIPASTFTSDPILSNFTSAMGSGGSLTLNAQNITVSNTATLTSGLVVLGTGNFTTLYISPTASSSYSNTMMYVTSGTSGYFGFTVGNTIYTDFIYPVGDNVGTSQYSPVDLYFSGASGTSSRVIATRVVDAAHPNINTGGTAANYLTRYWQFTDNQTAAYTYTADFKFINSSEDVVGTVSSIVPNRWNGSAWNILPGTMSAPTLSVTSTTYAANPLGGNDFTGLTQAPANDNCANATVITPANTCTAGSQVSSTVSGATNSGISGCTGTADDDVWFKFVAAATTEYISLGNTGGSDLVTQFFTGACGSQVSAGCYDTDPANQAWTGLTIGSTYYIRVYSYSSLAITGTAGAFTLCVCNSPCVQPTTQATITAYTATTASSTTVHWTRGNGDDVIVVGRLTSTTAVDPVQGTYYYSSSTFGNNTTGYSTGTGNYIVYNGTGTSVTVSGLASSTGYTFTVYEYNNSTYCYDIPGSSSTVTTLACTQPTTQATMSAYTSTTSTGTTVNWARGNGTGGVIVVGRLTSTSAVDPSGGITYNASSTFGSGDVTGTGNYVVYTGTGTTVSVTNLVASTGYTFTVYEYNSTNTCYKTPGSSSAITTLAPPHCNTPPTFDYTITPTTSWQTDGPNALASSECRIYKINMVTSNGYDFSICANDGVGGSCPVGDGDLYLYNSSGTNIWYIDGLSGCSYDASTIGSSYASWQPPSIGVYYLKVVGYSSAAITYTLAYKYTSAPANDECAGAVSITPAAPGAAACTIPPSFDANLATESASPGTYASCDYYYTSTTRDVWFSFVATATSHQINIAGSASYQPVVQAFAGACGSLGTAIGCAYASSTGGTASATLTGLTVGHIYYFRVYHESSSVPATTTFTVCILTAPTNDECSGAISITPNTPGTAACSSPPAYSSNLASQSPAPGSYASCDYNYTSNTRDVWFSFVATATSHQINIVGSASYSAVVQTFAGTCASPGTAIGCAYASSTGGTASLTLSGLTVGNTYRFRVYHASSSIPATTTFTVCILTAPANDEPCGAVPLTPGVTCSPTTGDVNLASQTKPYGSCDYNYTSSSNDVWYSFVATNTSHLINVQGSADFQAVVQAYSGTSCSGTLTSIGCYSASSTGSLASLQLTGLTVASTYYVRVYASNYYSTNTTTSFTICVIKPPANDEPCGAVDLGTITTTCNAVAGDAALATQTYAHSACDNASVARDVWYMFTTNAGGTSANVIVVSNGSYDAVIQAYSGACGSLTSIGCRQYFYGGTETLHLTGLTGSTTYYVRVYHSSSTIPGNTTFTICVVIPPVNDDCSGTTLTLGAAATSGTTVDASQSLSDYYSTGYDDDDVWYNFTASGNNAQIILNCSGIDGVLQLRKTICNGTKIVDHDFVGTGSAESIKVSNLTNGASYGIRVFSYNSGLSSEGTFTVAVNNTGYTPGTYDNVANAYIASVGTNSPGVSFANYGMEVGEPSGPNWNFDPDSNPATLANTEWFLFTPSVSGNYSISATTGNSFELGVYSATSAANLLAGSYSNVGSSTGAALPCLTLTAGVNYYIQVNGHLGAGGTPSVTIATVTVAPVADGASSVCVNANTPAFTDATAGGTWSITPGSGTASISTGGIVTGLSAGTVSVVYTVVTGGCTNSSTQTLTVNPLPVVSPVSGGATTVCVNATTPAFTDATVGGTWSITPGTGTASITTSGVVTGLTTGTVTVVYSYSDGTCSNTATQILTVNTLLNVAAIADGALSVCINESTPAFTDATSGGTWSITPGTGTANITTAGVVTGISPGTVTIIYTVFSGGCSNSATQLLTVNDLPTIAPIAGGASSVCVNGITPAFTDATIGGTWSITAGTGIASVTAGGLVTGLTAGTITLVYTYNDGNCTNFVTRVVTVNTTLSISPIANGASSVCINSTTPAFTDATSGGTWSITQGTGTASITSGGIVTGLTAGTVTVVYTVINGGCSDSTSQSLIVNPLPLVAPIAGGATSVCVNATTPAFTDATSGGVWSITSGTGTASITASGIVTGLTAGNVTVVYTYNNGTCSNISTQSLIINALPIVAPIAGGATSVCVNATTPAFTDATSGGVWSITSGTGTASITASGIVTGLTAGNVTVVCTYNNGTCSNISTQSLIINALPIVAPIAGGATSVCVNATTPAFTDATMGGVWSIISGTGTASITASGIVTGLTAGSVTVVYTYNNGTCSNTSTQSLTVNALPVVAPIAGGAASVCVNATTPAFTDATLGGMWSIIAGTGTASITASGIVTGLTAGNVTVVYTYNNGTCSNTSTQSLTVNALPVVAPIAGGATSVCVNATTPAFTDATSGGVWSITAGTGTASITASGIVTGLTAGNVIVVYTYNNGTCSNTSTQSLTVNTLPVVAPIAGGATSVCVNATTPPFTDATLGGIWSITAGTGTASITASGIVTGLTAGNVTVVYTYNNGTCSNTSTQSLTVNALPVVAPIAGGAISVCVNTMTPAFTDATSGGVWSITAGTGTASITASGIVTGLTAGNVTVVYTYNNGTCSTTSTQSLIINALPAINPISGGASDVCLGSTTPAFIDASFGGIWSITAGTGAASISTGGVATGVSLGTVTVVYTVTIGGCSNTVTQPLSVDALQTLYAIGGGAATVCVNSSTPQFTDATTGGVWSVVPITGTASIATNGVATGLTPGVVSVVYTIGTGGCSNSVSFSLKVIAIPFVAPITGGSNNICVNAATPAFLDATTGGTWSINAGTGSASITTAGVVTGISAGTVTVVYTYSDGSCSNTSTQALTVNALPNVAAIGGGSSTVAVNATTPAFTDATTGGTWSIVPGTGTASVNSGGVVTGLSAGTVTVKYSYNNGTCSDNATQVLTIINSAKTLDLTVFFEGFYNSHGHMNRTLNSSFIPNFGSNIVDTFGIELHDSTTYANVLCRIHGVILDTSGHANVSIPPALNGHYYITIKHRNHLLTVSSLPVSFAGAVITYNFSDNVSKAYGNNLKQIGSGVYGIYCGDVSQNGSAYAYPSASVQDGIIDIDDEYYIYSSYLNGDLGYKVSDLNGDGMVDIDDVYLQYDNYLLGVYSITP